MLMLKLQMERIDFQLEKLTARFDSGNARPNSKRDHSPSLKSTANLFSPDSVPPPVLDERSAIQHPQWHDLSKDVSMLQSFLQQELQKVNLDLEDRLKDLTRKAERHMQSISQQTERLSRAFRDNLPESKASVQMGAWQEDTSLKAWMRSLQEPDSHISLEQYESAIAKFVTNAMELRDRYATDVQLLFRDINVKDEVHKAAFSDAAWEAIGRNGPNGVSLS
eukprot:CAMPEP_0197688800 /NCGR_PEP_ID=MMETSP1338-20131121/105976_1 /TAXON_ID=43686 ORGANISM="Pelagodinium beii, Strain RCC1491" /NCGR_SAMPLE_ID=MMETSP1338 /ASSEMBLY_ACC=CAM_ASM_000754 /LENGTH=221 /DNA_ID=CAMNT_0043271061 /DNA_START=1 /DNA_END=666 /DNA_ORIENTATION=-